jgi:hypothetical protein
VAWITVYFGLIVVAQLTLGARVDAWWGAWVGWALGCGQAWIWLLAFQRRDGRRERLRVAVRDLQMWHAADVHMGCDAPWLPLPGYEDVAEVEVSVR